VYARGTVSKFGRWWAIGWVLLQGLELKDGEGCVCVCLYGQTARIGRMRMKRRIVCMVASHVVDASRRSDKY